MSTIMSQQSTHHTLFLPALRLNYTGLNASSASYHTLAAGPEPSTDYPLDNSSDFAQRS